MRHQRLPAGCEPVQPAGCGGVQEEYVRLAEQTGIRRGIEGDSGATVISSRTLFCKKTAAANAKPFIAVRQTCRVCAETVRQARSEEHTSELQSRQYLVCRLLLEKQKRLHPTE